MSSTGSSFIFDGCEYDPTVDNKFVDVLYQLISNRNVAKVKEFISTFLVDESLILDNDETTSEYTTIRIDSPFTADDFNPYEEYPEEYDESQESCNHNRLTDISFSNGLTPLIFASQKGFPELVEYFLSVGFDANKSISKSGFTALLGASSSISEDFESITECIKLLVNAGADTSVVLEKTNYSPLHFTAFRNNVMSCKFLIDKMDINSKDFKGCTPIMIASISGFSEVVTILKEAGADISIKNNLGMSAVELAMVNNHQNVTQLLMQSTDNLDFYKAWSYVFKDLTETENGENLYESCSKKFYSSKYFSDPVASMCSSLNLTHLQPIFEKHGVTFDQLRSMSDKDMKNLGIVKFSDRKCLLNLMQDAHKVNWTHLSIYTLNFKSFLTPSDVMDLVKNASDHLEFMQSTIKYIGLHLQTNPAYYSNYSQNKSFFDKCVTNCQFLKHRASSTLNNIVQIDRLFDKMYEYALEEDQSCQICDEMELLHQRKLANKFSNVLKTTLVLSSISIATIVVLKWRLLR